MVFRKNGTKILAFIPCNLSLVEYQLLNFLLFVVCKDLKKDVYSVPLGILRRYLNSAYSLKKLRLFSCRLEKSSCDLFDSIKINRSALFYSINKEFKTLLCNVYPPVNPFMLRCFSSKYAVFTYMLCSYFEKEGKVPPIDLLVLLEHFNLTKTVFKNLKYFIYRVIKKSISMVNEKSDIEITFEWDCANKTMFLTHTHKDFHSFFSSKFTPRNLLHAQINKKTQNDFFEILCAFGVSKTQALLFVKEYYYLNEEDLKKFAAYFKTTPQKVLFIHHWLN